MFWMPDQVRHDVFGTFYESINIKDLGIVDGYRILMNLDIKKEDYDD